MLKKLFFSRTILFKQLNKLSFGQFMSKHISKLRENTQIEKIYFNLDFIV